MTTSPFKIVSACLLLASCGSVGAESVVVSGTGPDELLKLRAGPSLGFNVVLGLPDGTALNRHGCVTEVGQTWCEVSLAQSPRVTGYVAADYLVAR